MKLLIAGLASAAVLLAIETARADDCSYAQQLLSQGFSVGEVARATGMSSRTVDGCRRALQKQGVRIPNSNRWGAGGPPPVNAMGSPPTGAAGPPPLNPMGKPPLNPMGVPGGAKVD